MIRFFERLFHRHDWGDIVLLGWLSWVQKCSRCDDVRGVMLSEAWAWLVSNVPVTEGFGE